MRTWIAKLVMLVMVCAVPAQCPHAMAARNADAAKPPCHAATADAQAHTGHGSPHSAVMGGHDAAAHDESAAHKAPHSKPQGGSADECDGGPDCASCVSVSAVFDPIALVSRPFVPAVKHPALLTKPQDITAAFDPPPPRV